MNLIRRFLARGFGADTEAATTSEYALLIGLVALFVLGAMTIFGSVVSNGLYAAAVAALP